MERTGALRRVILVAALLAFAYALSPDCLRRLLTRDGRFDGALDLTTAARAAQLTLLCVAALAALPRLPAKLRRVAENCVLAGASAFTVLVAVNFALPAFLGRLPVGLQGFVPEPFDVVVQSSKRGVVPERYLAIFGDSYAYGMGDWRIGVDSWSRDDWQAAHLIHRRTGVDVVSFGRPGRSSIGAYLTEPLRSRRMLRHRYPLADPTWILAYFYEGNDLAENLAELRERGYEGPLDRSSFAEFLERSVLVPERYELETARFLGIRFVARMLQQAVQRPPADRAVANWGSDLRETAAGRNRASIGGRELLLPLGQQAAPVDITGEELERALGVFERSLEYMQIQFPNAKIVVAYVPAPLSVYRADGPLVVESKEQSSIETSYVETSAASDQIARRVGAIVAARGLAFLDLRDPLRRAAGEEPLHGPLDWRHFNRRGYEAFTEALLAHSDQLGLPPAQD